MWCFFLTGDVQNFFHFWVVVFEQEIEAALKNGDDGAYHFFMQELIQEKVRLHKEKHKK